jgi:osmotically-inducible protein OsmY
LGNRGAVARYERIGPLLVAALGVAALAARPAAPAQVADVSRNETSTREIIITAARQADAVLTARVVQVLQDDPYVFADHVTVTTENGVVRVEGIVGDTGERFRILRLCRKIPGTRRVIDALELMSNDPDGG